MQYAYVACLIIVLATCKWLLALRCFNKFEFEFEFVLQCNVKREFVQRIIAKVSPGCVHEYVEKMNGLSRQKC